MNQRSERIKSLWSSNIVLRNLEIPQVIIGIKLPKAAA